MPMRKPAGRLVRSRRPLAEALEGRALLAVTFAPEATTPVDRTPTSVASADLNGDGIPDLVETYGPGTVGGVVRSDAVAIRLGRGDGTFLAPTIIDQTGRGPVAVAFGDFNRDGKLDFVVEQAAYTAEYTYYKRETGIPGFPNQTIYVPVVVPEVPSTVQVFLARGDGTFAGQTPIKVTPSPHALSVGDLNGDGNADLVVDRAELLGHGDGTFGAAIVDSSDTRPAEVATALADLNGDGKLDLIEAVAPRDPFSGGIAGQVDVRLGRGDGTFGAPTHVAEDAADPPSSIYQYAHPVALTVADFNHDGKPDLAVLDRGLHVLNGLGNGTFGPDRAYSVGVDATAVVSGDFDRDGKLDLAVTSAVAGQVDVVRGNGDGTFEASRLFGLDPSVTGTVLADLNGDGKPDLATLSDGPQGTTLEVRLGLGDGTFGPASIDVLGGYHAASLLVGDLNGDGKPDLVAASGGIPGTIIDHGVTSYTLDGARLAVLKGLGNGTFSAPVEITQGLRSPVGATIADVNGDGKPDLIEIYHTFDASGASGLSILPGLGDGTFGPAIDLASAPNDAATVAVGDLNGDGRPDLVVTEASNGGVGVILNTGGAGVVSFASPVMFASGIAPGPIAIGDLNGDGRPDLVVGNGGTPAGPDLINANVVLLAGRGDGTFLAPVVLDSVVGQGPSSIAVADINGDGTNDLTLDYEPRVAPGARIDLLFGRASAPGTFLPASRLTIGPGAARVLIGDLNGDRQPDIVGLSRDMTVFLGQGGGTFVSPSGFDVAANPVGLAVADFNGDGRPDLVTLGQADGTGTLLINTSATSPFPFSVQGRTLRGIGGTMTVATLATISDSDPLGRATDFRAAVDWGDGSPIERVLVSAAGPATYAVSGHHAYNRAGLFTITVAVDKVLGGSRSTASLAGIETIPVKPVLPLVGALDPASDSGASSTDRLTDVNRPRFFGASGPSAVVQIVARPVDASGAPGSPLLVGLVRAGADGLWSLQSVPLVDGSYTITAFATGADGTGATTQLVGVDHPLTIDTAGPRIVDVRIDPRHGRVIVTYLDVLSGMDTQVNSSAYTFQRGLVGTLQRYGVTGVETTAGASPVAPLTVSITFGKGRPIGPGLRYLLKVDSARVVDRAGNHLDGTFDGTFPTGKGQAGGSFAARVIVGGGRSSIKPVHKSA